jgi:hypothetical protein
MELSRWIAEAAVLVAGAATPPRAAACSVCGCGDPLVDVSDSVPYAAPLRIALDFEVLTASAASDEDPAARESVTQVTLRPVIVYSPTEELNLVLQVPLVHKDWSLSRGAEEGSATHMGLGDIDVGARWFFFQRTSFESQSRQALGVTGGITLPTGPTGATENGVRLDDQAQLGTGAFGPYRGSPRYVPGQTPRQAGAAAAQRLRDRVCRRLHLRRQTGPIAPGCRVVRLRCLYLSLHRPSPRDVGRFSARAGGVEPSTFGSGARPTGLAGLRRRS